MRPSPTDPELQPYLTAPTDRAAETELARLMEAAAPVVAAFLSRKRRRGTDPDAEDIASEARVQLAVRLQRLRADPSLPPITDFAAYVSTVVYTAWAHSLRQRHPARALLLNRLRYLLENRTARRGFALWTGPGGERWAGLEPWRGGAPAPASSPRAGRLLADPRAAAAEIFGAPAAAASLPLADVVARLFAWLDGPLLLRDLADLAAEWQQLPARPEPLPPDHTPDDAPAAVAAAPCDPRPSPHDALRWREYLLWLWEAAAARLTLRQRAAFLLHSPCLQEMELLGLTSVRRAAAALELSAERMAELWNALPLDDRAIGALLGVEPQGVINLRKVARAILGRAWHQWLHEK